MAIITDTTDFADINALLGEGVALDNAYIGRDVFLGTATQIILARKGITEAQYNALSDAEKLPIKRAIKYLTAIYILPTLDRIIQESTDEVVIRKSEVDIKSIINVYQSIVDDEVPPPDGDVAGSIPVFVGKIS